MVHNSTAPHPHPMRGGFLLHVFFKTLVTVATLQQWLIIRELRVTRTKNRCHSLSPPPFEGGTSSVRRRHLLRSKAAPPPLEGGTSSARRRHLPVCSTLWNTLFHAMEHLLPIIPILSPKHWNRSFQALEQRGCFVFS